MKATFALSTIVAVAAAQTTTSAALSPEQTCLAACSPSDVNCRAICVGVPHPGDAQISATTDCVAACDQGDGSTAASEAYAKCLNGCISSYIITSGTAAPGGEYTTAGISATGAAASASGTAAGSGASGQYTLTILVPVPNYIAACVDPPISTQTIEIYLLPADCDGACDEMITLSLDEPIPYLPTNFPAPSDIPNRVPVWPSEAPACPKNQSSACSIGSTAWRSESFTWRSKSVHRQLEHSDKHHPPKKREDAYSIVSPATFMGVEADCALGTDQG
jgi:hypothetical protein